MTRDAHLAKSYCKYVIFFITMELILFLCMHAFIHSRTYIIHITMIELNCDFMIHDKKKKNY